MSSSEAQLGIGSSAMPQETIQIGSWSWALKLACPYGQAEGLWGMKENEKLVAKTRELVCPDIEIMLDCYMAFDVDYTIQLARRLKPYGLKWIEEFLIPEDLDGYVAVRKAVNWVSLAGVEHWFSPWRFREAIKRRPWRSSAGPLLGWRHNGLSQDLPHGRLSRPYGLSPCRS
jgi:hypothetical protein